MIIAALLRETRDFIERTLWLYYRPVPPAPVLHFTKGPKMATVSFTAVPVDPTATQVEGTFIWTPTGGTPAAPVVVTGAITDAITTPVPSASGVMTATQVQINALGERTNVSPAGSINVSDGFSGLTPAAPALVLNP